MAYAPAPMADAVKKHPRAVRWMHWVNFPLLSVMVWSGLLIYWAYDPYRLGWGETTLVSFFSDGFYDALGVPRKLALGMAYHFAFAWAFALNGIAYVVYTTLSGEWRYVVPRPREWRDALYVTLHDLRLRRDKPAQGRYNAAQKFAYTGAIGLGAGLLTTGLAIYKPTQLHLLTSLLGGYQAARMEHFILTGLVLAFFVVHLAQVVRAGWANFAGMVTGYAPADAPGEPTAAPTPTDPAPPADAP